MQKVPVSLAQLRSFGLIFAAMVAVLFGLLLPWLLEGGWPYWPWYISGTVAALALVAPPLLRPLYRLWMGFGLIMGWINTRIILGLVYYAILVPMGLLMKLLRKDPMRRRLQPDANSYREVRDEPARQQMEKPY